MVALRAIHGGSRGHAAMWLSGPYYHVASRAVIFTHLFPDVSQSCAVVCPGEFNMNFMGNFRLRHEVGLVVQLLVMALA